MSSFDVIVAKIKGDVVNRRRFLKGEQLAVVAANRQ